MTDQYTQDYDALTGKLALLATWELPKYAAMYDEPRYLAELEERIERLRQRVRQ